jgi:hypothetical protein
MLTHFVVNVARVDDKAEQLEEDALAGGLRPTRTVKSPNSISALLIWPTFSIWIFLRVIGHLYA